MRNCLVNQQCLTRKLLQLSLLCAMMLVPKFAWAQNNYNLWIGETQVTSENASAIHNADPNNITVSEGGSVSFDAENNILTLNNATLKKHIVSSLTNLTIKFKGTNKVNTDRPYSDYHGICSEINSATLTFVKDGDASLELNASTNKSIIFGFASVYFGSGDGKCYLHPASPCVYTSDNGYDNIYGGGSIQFATISGETAYPLWIINSQDGATQVTSTGITAAVTKGTVKFNPADNSLSLKDAQIDGKILSALDNLTLNIEGTNYIATSDSGSTVRTAIPGSLTITKTSDNASLQMNCGDGTRNQLPVIQGFSSLSYDGLNLAADEGTIYGEYILYDYDGDDDDVIIYGLYNPNKTNGYEKRITSALFTTATVYPLWVGKTPVISDNASQITGDHIESENISFNAESNTLTLKNANIFMADWEGFPIESGLPNLKIKLIGENHVQTNSDYPYFVHYNGESGASHQLTFETEWGTNIDYVTCFGSLSIEGISSMENIANGYTITNTFDESTSTKGWRSEVNDNSLILSYLEIFDLSIAGTTVTSKNMHNVLSENDVDNVSFTPASPDNGNVNILSMNGVSLEGNIISGLGDLKIVIQGENTIAVRDTAAVIRSTNGGKLRISKPESAQSPTLVLQNDNSDNHPNYHCPVIKDFDSFELTEGLYLSNARSDGSEGEPATYEAFDNLDLNGGKTTKGLVNPTDAYTWQPRGISKVTISTNVSYPIWISDHRQYVGAGYNPVYVQVTAENANSVFTTDTESTGTASFTPASANNNYVNTLTLSRVATKDAIFTSLPNLTIEFSGENSIGESNGNNGFIHGSDPNAVLTFKALTSDAELAFSAGNERSVVEGFGDVAFENAIPQYSDDFFYDKTDRRYKNRYGDLSILTVAADPSPYGLTIGDVAVNSFNADNILGDGKVSYDPDKYELTLNNATIGSSSEVKNITFNGTALTVVLKGTNTLYGGFTRTETNSKGNLSFYTDAKNVTSLTMSTDIPTDKFELSYQNGLKKDGLIISLPSEYGITIAGTAITPDNRENVFTDANKTVSFNSNNQLVLNGATINGEIVVDNAASLPDNTLTLYLIGKSTINTTTGQYAFKCNNGELILEFVFENNSSSEIEFNVVGESLTSNVVLNTDCRKVKTGNTHSYTAYMPNYVNSEHEVKQTDFSEKLNESSNTNGTIIDNLLFAMGEDTSSPEATASTGGYDQTLGQVVFTENTAMTPDKVNESAGMTLASPEFIAAFKGLAGSLLAGENIVKLLDVVLDSNYDFFVKIGNQEPINIRGLLKEEAGKLYATINAVLAEPSSMLIYMQKKVTSPAPAMKVDHHIGPKSSVAGALGGVKVSNSSVQNSAGPAATYKAMEVATMAAAIAGVGDVHNGYTCSDPDITDLPDDMFVDNTPSPAPRRAGSVKTILPEGLTFLDFSGTSITGMEISREKGAFNGVPENVFIYMPAGNSVAAGTKNVVIGDICDVVELNGSTDAQPFKAKKDFKAGQATLKRTFDAGSTNSKATIYLPYNIEQEDADKLGKFYKYTGNDGTTVTMNTVTTGGLKANMPYIFEAKEGGVVDPLVRVVDVVANPAETEGFKGVYERKEYEAGMYCYAAEATSENAKGQFVEMGPRSFVPPFRAYIIGSGVPSYAIAWDGIIDNMDDDENTTAVESVKTIGSEKTREGWWTLNGMRMTEKPKKAGLYILNGRMVVVKN